MELYYLNRNQQSGGEREVHISTCSFLPEPKNRISLGYFSHCREAMKEAKKHYDDVDGCFFCCPECHTK
jgi:hypothetical protein